MSPALRRLSRGARLLAVAHLAIDPIRGHDRLLSAGPVITLRLPFFAVTYLLGAEANRFAYAHPDLFLVHDAYQSLSPVSGDTPLLRSDGDDHVRRRNVAAQSFGRARISRCTQLTAAFLNQVIDNWKEGDQVDLSTVFEAPIRKAAISTLFGPRLADSERAIADEQLAGLRLLEDDPIRFRLRQALRTPLYRAATTGRARLIERIESEIDLRTNLADEPTDLLSELVEAQRIGILQLAEVIDQVTSLIGSSYATTNAALAWACHYLITSESTWNHPSKQIALEVLRLHPPAVVTARITSKEVRFSGEVIPPGRMTLLSPYVSHRSPDIWADPDRFDPGRWNGIAPRGAAGRGAYHPFGGGVHRCIGAQMASAQLEVAIDILKARVSFDRAGRGRVRPRSIAAMRPSPGVHAIVRTLRKGTVLEASPLG